MSASRRTACSRLAERADFVRCCNSRSADADNAGSVEVVADQPTIRCPMTTRPQNGLPRDLDHDLAARAALLEIFQRGRQLREGEFAIDIWRPG